MSYSNTIIAQMSNISKQSQPWTRDLKPIMQNMVAGIIGAGGSGTVVQPIIDGLANEHIAWDTELAPFFTGVATKLTGLGQTTPANEINLYLQSNPTQNREWMDYFITISNYVVTALKALGQ